MAPSVAVIMSNYRGGAHLGAAIESVLAQSLGDLKLITVDDCFGDGSLAILDSYRQRDEHVHLITLAVKLGPVGACNWGIAAVLAHRGHATKDRSAPSLLISLALAPLPVPIGAGLPVSLRAAIGSVETVEAMKARIIELRAAPDRHTELARAVRPLLGSSTPKEYPSDP